MRESLAKTIAIFLPAAARAASAMSPLAREYAKRRLAAGSPVMPVLSSVIVTVCQPTDSGVFWAFGHCAAVGGVVDGFGLFEVGTWHCMLRSPGSM